MSQYKTNIEIDDVEDVPVAVEYEAVSASKLSPDDPGHISICQVRLIEDDREITLTSQQESRMEEEIGEWLSGMYDQDPPDGYE
jgi:hypothetical protein